MTLLISAILAMILAVAGFVYSVSDSAKIVGNWSMKYFFDETGSYTPQRSNTIEFTITGNMILENHYEYSDGSNSDHKTSATYSVEAEDHVIVQGYGTYTYTYKEHGSVKDTETEHSFPSIISYHLTNGNNELLIDGEDSMMCYIRTDFPFYVIMMIVSAVLAIVGGILVKKFVEERKLSEIYKSGSDTSAPLDSKKGPIIPGSPYDGVPPFSSSL